MADQQRAPRVTPRPNYKRKCMVCGQRPTVDLRNVQSAAITHTELCGPCCFGEARMVDPKEWDK